MVHRYLQQRGNWYWFRWRIPADLRPAFGVTELKRSLGTLDARLALTRAAKLFSAVAGIQQARYAYLTGEIGAQAYGAELARNWGMAKKAKRQTVRTELITFRLPMGEIVDIDYGGDVQKEVAAAQALAPNLAASGGASNGSALPTDGPMFSSLFEEFLAHKTKNGLAVKLQKQYRRDFATLIEIVGDQPASQLSRRDLKKALLSYSVLPKRNKHPYKGVCVPELLEMEVPEVDRVSSKTVQEVRKMVQGVFAFAVEQDYLAVSPARELKLGLASKGTFASFRDEEVRQIVAAASRESEAWKRWIPMLAAYSGCRRGELVQLRREDIKLDIESGRHYLLIVEDAGKVKNANANRQVPLHRRLVEEGFLPFVESSNDRLFQGLDPQTVTKWFGVLLERLEIDRFDDFGNRKVFHSLRHVVITKARAAGNPIDHVQQVVGHEKIDVGITDVYTGVYSLATVLPVIDCLGFD